MPKRTESREEIVFDFSNHLSNLAGLGRTKTFFPKESLVRYLQVLMIALLMWAPTASAASFQIAKDLMLEFELPSQRWQTATGAPDQIVRMVAGGEGPALLEKTRRMLAANELYVWNPASHAYLMVDVSPLKEGDAAPSDRQVMLSARYAGSALEAEEGVAAVRHSTIEASLNGVRTAYRLDATYSKKGQPHRFAGLIGFSQPYWVYFYYNDPMTDDGDFEEMESILKSVRFHRHVPN